MLTICAGAKAHAHALDPALVTDLATDPVPATARGPAASVLEARALLTASAPSRGVLMIAGARNADMMTAGATIGGTGMSALIMDMIVVGTTITIISALSRRAMGRRLRRGGGGGGIIRMDGNGVAGRMVVSIVSCFVPMFMCVVSGSR
jgi:hypothetical protein